MSLNFNFGEHCSCCSFTQPHLTSDHTAKRIISTSPLTHTRSMWPARTFPFFAKNIRRVHKFMFYVANHTFHENNFFFVLSASFMFLSLHRKKLNPKTFPSIIEMQNHKKNCFQCSSCQRNSGRSMDSVSVNRTTTTQDVDIKHDTFLIFGGH